jgi:hypothetical protein
MLVTVAFIEESLALKHQVAVQYFHLQVFLFNAGKIGFQHKGIIRFVEVDRGVPSASLAGKSPRAMNHFIE